MANDIRTPRAAASGAAATPRQRARRLHPADRREQLLACAVRVFARRGLGGARHAEIAREAGVSVPAVFVYFPTCDALVRAVLDEVERFYVAMATQIHARDLPAADALLQHARAFAQSVDTHPDYARVWLDWSTAIRDGVWPRYLHFQERMVSFMAKVIARGCTEGAFAPDGAPDDVARLLVGSAHMVALLKFTPCGAEMVDRFLTAVMRTAFGVGGAAVTPSRTRAAP